MATNSACDRAALRIVIGRLSDGVGFGADVARIDSANDLVAIAKQLAPEAFGVDFKFDRKM